MQLLLLQPHVKVSSYMKLVAALVDSTKNIPIIAESSAGQLLYWKVTLPRN